MTNGFYNPTSLTAHTRARTAEVNAQLTGVGAGFDKLPTEAEIKKGKIAFVATDTGVANAYVVALPYPRTTLEDGEEIRFRAANTNDGASTINRDGVGVVSVRDYGGSALTGGEIAAGAFTDVVYDAGFGYFRIVAPRVSIGTVTVNNDVKASVTDTTPGKLTTKVIAVGLLKATLKNGGGNENIEIATIGYAASGTDTYAITPAPAITAYAAYQAFLVTFTNANTGAATLNASGLGAKAITKNGATALALGDIPAGCIKLCVYDGTQFQIVPTFIPDDGQTMFYNSVFGL